MIVEEYFIKLNLFLHSVDNSILLNINVLRFYCLIFVINIPIGTIQGKIKVARISL